MKKYRGVTVKHKIIIAITGLVFFFTACGTQPYKKENSALIVFKTPTFKYADMGFIYENSNEVKAEIYGSGQPLMSLTISKDSVCMSLLACMTKRSFNQQVLNVAYPDSILDNIFRGKPIINGQNSRKSSNGFTQKIISHNKYNIEYSVLNNDIVFRDTINHILIKIKKQ
jgi:hypothetical protein